MGLINAEQLLDEFWANYPQPPSSHEKKSLLAWAIDLNDDKLLEETLDINKHPKQSSGAIPKATLATLKSIADSIRVFRGDFNRQADRSLLENEECFYCSYGKIMIVVTKNRDWYGAVSGRCSHCRDGEKGSNWLKPAEPQERIIELARKWEITCPEAVDKVVENRENMLREKPNADKDIPF